MTPDPLTEAAENVEKWTVKRNRLIREAQGSLRDVATRAGISHTQVANIRKRGPVAGVPD